MMASPSFDWRSVWSKRTATVLKNNWSSTSTRAGVPPRTHLPGSPADNFFAWRLYQRHLDLRLHSQCDGEAQGCVASGTLRRLGGAPARRNVAERVTYTDFRELDFCSLW